MIKTVIIMRGVPGSGKSTKAKTYGGLIVSADNYFMRTGTYQFDRAKLGMAHSECRREFLSAIKKNELMVVVDNTNTTHKEYKEYVDRAKSYGYVVLIDNLYTGGLTAKELAERNIHRVPEESIQRMITRYQP